jgi:hypothetical protein
MILAVGFLTGLLLLLGIMARRPVPTSDELPVEPRTREQMTNPSQSDLSTAAIESAS